MKSTIFSLVLMCITLLATAQETDYVKISEALLEAIRYEKSTEDLQNQLAEVPLKILSKNLDTDERRLAFWMNTYNAYVQILLTKNPELFEDRGTFFKKPRMTVANQKMSFDDIEHGIIRASQSKYLLGLIPKFWGIEDYEKELRVKERDGRIHFALNCGAKSCPPIAIYAADRIDEQLNASSKAYLERTTEYKPEEDKAKVTPLFSWFRGDFGGLSGVKSYLRRYEIVPAGAQPSLTFKDYDWTLDLGNYVDL
ncbi:MAG: DUF547 domain-containing protein [Bacteroidota bacterium]